MIGWTRALVGLGAGLLVIGIGADAVFHLLPGGTALDFGLVVGASGERAHALTAAGLGLLLFPILWQLLMAER